MFTYADELHVLQFGDEMYDVRELYVVWFHDGPGAL
jgi:hypothetical protein